jgi:hypothetical protein
VLLPTSNPSADNGQEKKKRIKKDDLESTVGTVINTNQDLITSKAMFRCRWHVACSSNGQYARKQRME